MGDGTQLHLSERDDVPNTQPAFRLGRRRSRQRCASVSQTPAQTSSRRTTSSAPAVAGSLGILPATASSSSNGDPTVRDDHAAVTALLGRAPRGSFDVVVRHDGRFAGGDPQSADPRRRHADADPLLAGGRARAHSGVRARVGGRRARRGARRSTRPRSPIAHERYARERTPRVPSGHTGPRPFGGVGGTRVGREVPPRALRLVPRRRRRPGGPLGRRPPPLGRGVRRRDANGCASIDCGTNSIRLLVGERRPATARSTIDRPAHADHPARSGSRCHGPARARSHRADDERSARVPRRDGRTRCRAGSHRGDIRGARRRQPRRVLRRCRSSSSARGPSCCRARRKVTSRSSVRQQTSTGPTARSSSSTSAVARPSSSRAPTMPTACISVDMGCVRLTEKELHHDPPLPEELSIALSMVDAYLDDVRREVPAVDDARTFIGVAGTITTVAAVEIGLADVRPRRHPSLPSDARGRGGRVPHAGHRAPRSADRQPRARRGPRRRHRRRLLHPGRHLPARSASTSASSPKPTSSTACSTRSSDPGPNVGAPWPP